MVFLRDGDHLIQHYHIPAGFRAEDAVGKRIHGTGEYISADGSVELADLVLTFVSRDEFHYLVTNRRKNGRSLPDLKWVEKRKSQ
jgi:hypothetical protein